MIKVEEIDKATRELESYIETLLEDPEITAEKEILKKEKENREWGNRQKEEDEKRVEQEKANYVKELSSEYPNQRKDAIEALSKLCAKEYAKDIAALFFDDDTNVRYSAIEAVGKL